MKKIIFPALLISCLALGLVLENHFNFIKETSTSDVIPEPITKTPIEKPIDPVWADAFKTVEITSPFDSVKQPAYFYKTKSSEPQPLIVSLHTWSFDYKQYDSINEFSLAKDYNYIHPNFRGVNNKKEACCSEMVISDIDASIDYALENGNVDPSKIYVIGMSGGGYATIAMFMKSKHKIKKFSSWVPLVDLVQWYEETKLRKFKYTDEILACTSSKNGVLNKKVAKEKSPIYWKTPTDKLDYATLEITTGLFDGMEGNGVIPITHSINFYNKLLTDLHVKDSSKYVSAAEKLALLEFRKPINNFGALAGRKIALIKQTNNIKLTLFEGGHEILERYAFEQLIK